MIGFKIIKKWNILKAKTQKVGALSIFHETNILKIYE
jgi:hypothetical protein